MVRLADLACRRGLGVVDASTVDRLGLAEFQNAAGHLTGAWRVPQVRVEQVRPGLVRLRALLVDPLTQPTPRTG
ncbi:hypothetical protein Micau_1208 [Micromonospora aurantiaca ATCC 27029]|nr:hypothetical protein Micau_1208 [Micromonospora aurantiaca ATCC 27029]